MGLYRNHVGLHGVRAGSKEVASRYIGLHGVI